jgi:hypothetical protein
MPPSLSLCGIPVTLVAPSAVDWRLADALDAPPLLEVSVREHDTLPEATGRRLFEGPRAALERLERLVTHVPTFALCSEPDLRLAVRVDAASEVSP